MGVATDAQIDTTTAVSVQRAAWPTTVRLLHVIDIDTPPIYILMLTSSGAKADREQAEQYDCVKGFIEKPLTREHLEALAESLAESPE